MSEALRAKLKLATGIAPSLLDCRPVWSALETAIDDWGHSSLGNAVSLAGTRIRRMSGKDALVQLETCHKTVFVAAASPILAAIAINEDGVRQIADIRLGNDGQDSDQAPRLLVRLLAEQSALQLWNRLSSETFLDCAQANDTPSAQRIDTIGALEPESRYIVAAYDLSASGTSVSVSLVLDAAGFTENALKAKPASEPVPGSSAHRKLLRESVRCSGVQLVAVLETLQMTLGDCTRLEVGDTLAIPGVDLSMLALCTETTNGRLQVGIGEMGAWKHQRAVKLSGPVNEGFARKVWDQR